MAILNSDIKDTLNYLLTINNVLAKETRNIKNSRFNLDKIVPQEIKGAYSQEDIRAISFFDKTNIIFFESAIMSLVASFERVMIAKYKTTQGEVKKAVRNMTRPPHDYYKSREKYIINTERDNLGNITQFIEGHIDVPLFEQLKKVKKQRDYYAHGKRFPDAPLKEYSLEEAAHILDAVISAIRNE